MEDLDCEWHWQQKDQYQTWYDLRWINSFCLFIVGGAKTWHKAYCLAALMVIYFSCCTIQTWAHVPFHCPCVCFRKEDKPNIFYYYRNWTNGVEGIVCPFNHCHFHFLNGVKLYSYLLCFFCRKIQTRWGFVNGQVAFSHNLGMKGKLL